MHWYQTTGGCGKSTNWNNLVSLGNYHLFWKDLSNNHSDPDFPHDINHAKLALVHMQCAEMHVGNVRTFILTKKTSTLFWWLTLAPASNSLWTISVCPFSAAIPRGTEPPWWERETVNWVWFQTIREWDTTLSNTQTIRRVRTQMCKTKRKKCKFYMKGEYGM